MQPIAGLHVGSLTDPRHFDVRLHHEDWHGPFDPAHRAGYDLVFLSGLQPDFDRMRQLSYFFRRRGDSVRAVVAASLRGSLKSIYRSPIDRISPYAIDHGLFAENGINPLLHLMESSRGCSFKCRFCVIPSAV